MGSSAAEGFEGRPALARRLCRARPPGERAGGGADFLHVWQAVLEGGRHEASIRALAVGRVVAGPRGSAMSWRLRLSHGLNLDTAVFNLRARRERRPRVVWAGSANDPPLRPTSSRPLWLSPFCHNSSFSPSSRARRPLNSVPLPCGVAGGGGGLRGALRAVLCGATGLLETRRAGRSHSPLPNALLWAIKTRGEQRWFSPLVLSSCHVLARPTRSVLSSCI